jgi:hypothetical protein
MITLQKRFWKTVLYFLGIVVLQGGYIALVSLGYIIFSMLFFGEGANSFMYTAENQNILISLVLGIPAVINAIQAIRYFTKNDLPKSIGYIILFIVLLVGACFGVRIN